MTDQFDVPKTSRSNKVTLELDAKVDTEDILSKHDSHSSDDSSSDNGTVDHKVS